MTGDQPIDLSALDPGADPARWSAVVQATARRVDQVLAARRVDPLTLIAGWMKSVTSTVVLLLLLLVPVELLLERREVRHEQVERLIELSAESIREGGSISGAQLARALDSELTP